MTSYGVVVIFVVYLSRYDSVFALVSRYNDIMQYNDMLLKMIVYLYPIEQTVLNLCSLYSDVVDIVTLFSHGNSIVVSRVYCTSNTNTVVWQFYINAVQFFFV